MVGKRPKPGRKPTKEECKQPNVDCPTTVPKKLRPKKEKRPPKKVTREREAAVVTPTEREKKKGEGEARLASHKLTVEGKHFDLYEARLKKPLDPKVIVAMRALWRKRYPDLKNTKKLTNEDVKRIRLNLGLKP